MLLFYALVNKQAIKNCQQIGRLMNMLKLRLLISYIILSFMLASCANQQSTPPPLPPSEKASSDELERGFDPCLVNPKLASCKKKSG